MTRAGAGAGVQHVIASLTFHPGEEDGPLSCACGMSMLASEFLAHRLAVKAVKRANGFPLRNEYDYEASASRRRASYHTGASAAA